MKSITKTILNIIRKINPEWIIITYNAFMIVLIIYGILRQFFSFIPPLPYTHTSYVVKLASISSVSLAISVVALCNTIIGLLDSEGGKYGFNQFELVSRCMPKYNGILYFQIISVVTALIVFISYMMDWCYLVSVNEIVCVSYVFLLIFVWVLSRTEKFTINFIKGIILKDCRDIKLSNMPKKNERGKYKQSDLIYLSGKNLYEIMRKIDYKNDYTVALFTGGCLSGFKDNISKQSNKKSIDLYYKCIIYDRVFNFIKRLNSANFTNLLYREKILEFVQDSFNKNNTEIMPVRLGFICALIDNMLEDSNYTAKQASDISILNQHKGKEFFGEINEERKTSVQRYNMRDFGKELYKDCILNDRNYMVADIYVCLEIYSHIKMFSSSNNLFDVMKNYPANYSVINRIISESLNDYVMYFKELISMNVIKSSNIKNIIDILSKDLKEYVENYNYKCKSNLIRMIYNAEMK